MTFQKRFLPFLATSVMAFSLINPIPLEASAHENVSSKKDYVIDEIISDNTIKTSYSETCEDLIILQYEKQVIDLVNKERVKRKLAPLKINYTLCNVARLKSQDMVKKNYFSHYSPTYGSPFKMMERYGIKFIAAGENIAKGQKTPTEVMKGWMNSPGHRNNILSPIYKEIGVGIAKLPNGTYCWTQMFIKPR